jgi:hypothetical protein
VDIVIFSAIIISCFAQQDRARTICSHRSATPQQTSTLAQEKRLRTPAQKKIDSHLLQAVKCSRVKSDCEGLPTDDLVEIDSKGRVRVDIRAKATPKILALVRKLGGKVVVVLTQFQSIEALVPLNRLEDLAQAKEVKFIGLPAKPMTSEVPPKSNEP